MSKGSGGTRASRGGSAGTGEMPRKSANQLSRYDGEGIADGKIKVTESHLLQISDNELHHAEENVRESLRVRGTGWKTPSEYTPEEVRLKAAQDLIRKESRRRASSARTTSSGVPANRLSRYDKEENAKSVDLEMQRAEARLNAKMEEYRKAVQDSRKEIRAKEERHSKYLKNKRKKMQRE